MHRIEDCQIFSLPTATDQRGRLTYAEAGNHIPFEFQRAFYVYDTPKGVTRGSHAHFTLHQAIICLSGSIEVNLDDGTTQKKIILDDPAIVLHIQPMIWATETVLADHTVYLVLASAPYDRLDYIHEHAEFIRMRLAERERNSLS